MFIADNQKRKIAGWQIGLLGLSIFANAFGGVAMAAAPGAVVINEVAWAGSADSANDEWIELYNATGAAVDLSGWKIKDDGVDSFTFPAGSSIAAHGYFLLEDRELATSVTADLLYNMSLANTGDSLQLLDTTGLSIDIVNGSGGTWYAGSSTNYSSMERKDALAGDLASNFAASTGSGATGAAGSALIGTPRALNSISTVPVGAAQIKAEFNLTDAHIGDTGQLKVRAENLVDLFSYGFELAYDPTKLEFQSATGAGFLSNNGAVSTSFQSGLKAGQVGTVLVAEARTIDPKVGISGSGDLFVLNFKVVGGEGSTANVNFANGSFVSSSSADLSVTLVPATLNLVSGVIAPATLLQATTGVGRYQIKLSWTASTSAPDHYRVERKNVHGDWVVLAGVVANEFIDQDSVSGGGNIVPGNIYSYRVTAVKGTLTSSAAEISAQDGRGVKGDNNRSDLLDGRDLEKLARHFAETDVLASFDPLVDTTYDGVINGSDLIDIGSNFAQKY